MQHSTIYGLIVGSVVLVVVGFLAGMQSAGQAPVMMAQQQTTTTSVPAPQTPAQPVYGTVESAAASSVTVKLQDGTTQVFSLGVTTQISEGTVIKHASDLSAGMSVVVALVPGSTDAAQYIQILPPPPSH
jgi:hypothetical protein